MTQNNKKIFKIGILAIFFSLIAVYAFFQSYDLIFGIKIRDVQINGQPAQAASTVTEKVTEITGNAENAVKLYLNEREISIDIKGNFDETIALLPGYNIINIKALDKFGNMDEKNYQLMYLTK